MKVSWGGGGVGRLCPVWCAEGTVYVKVCRGHLGVFKGLKNLVSLEHGVRGEWRETHWQQRRRDQAPGDVSCGGFGATEILFSQILFLGVFTHYFKHHNSVI